MQRPIVLEGLHLLHVRLVAKDYDVQTKHHGRSGMGKLATAAAALVPGAWPLHSPQTGREMAIINLFL